MNYEEKYNEILEWARKNKARLNGVPIEEVLPELAESEEERIRKELVAFFIEVRNREGNEGYWHDLKVANILAYLEKQKEQKPAEWSEEDWKLLDEVREHIIGVIGDKPDLTPNKIYDGFLDLIDKLKFAKPQLKQEWSKEDKDVIDEAAELALGWECPNLSAKLKSILSRVKPAEWSEEDEKYLNRVINLWVNDFGEDSDTVKWLKSLRPSWKPSEDELAKKHLDGYCMGREDTLREMKDFIESHFNCENAKKGTPIVYNTQSGTSTLKAEG